MTNVHELRIRLGIFIAALRSASLLAYEGMIERLPVTVLDDETGLQVLGLTREEHILLMHDDLETATIMALVRHSRNRAILVKRVADAVKHQEANE
jgi:hypothetical protein